MGVEIDEARGNDQATGVQDLVSGRCFQAADFGDFTVLDSQVALETRSASPVYDGPILDNQIVVCHQLSPLTVAFDDFASRCYCTGLLYEP